jgi:hypothetical protein
MWAESRQQTPATPGDEEVLEHVVSGRLCFRQGSPSSRVGTCRSVFRATTTATERWNFDAAFTGPFFSSAAK